MKSTVKLLQIYVTNPPSTGENAINMQKRIFFKEDLIFNLIIGMPIAMSGISGFCLKCKSYVPISNGTRIKMSNGRTRMAGSCSKSECTGKISKIIS